MWTVSLLYVAAPGKEFTGIAAVDKPGIKIGTIQGAASDRILTREIRPRGAKGQSDPPSFTF